MAYFPFMIQLDDKQCLIVGGGAVAARKAAQMCEFGACVTVTGDLRGTAGYRRYGTNR